MTKTSTYNESGAPEHCAGVRGTMAALVDGSLFTLTLPVDL